MEILKHIKRYDSLSPEIKLKYKKDFQNIKSSFGGCIILSYILFLGAAIYFSIRFFTKENYTINQNTRVSSLNNLTDFQRIPFMITTKVNPTNVTDQLTYLQFTIKVRQVVQAVSTDEINLSYEFEQCDLKNPKHVSEEYKQTIIDSGYDISTYLCVNWKNDTVNLIGTYGQNQNITSISITVLSCDNSTSTVRCRSPEEIFDAVKRINLSVLTVSNDVNHDEDKPNKPSIAAQKIRSNGFMETDIYIFYNKIQYQSDQGFLLKSLKNTDFFQFSGITTEIGDFNDKMKFGKSFTFFRLYVTVSREMIIYHRNYEKAQVVLALVGGIVNGIMILAKILNYNIGQRMLYIEIYNSIPELYMAYEELDSSLLQKRDSISNNNNPSKNKVKEKEDDIKNNNFIINSNSNQSKLKGHKTIIMKKFNISWIKLALPSFLWSSEESKQYKKIEDSVDQCLCLTEIIKNISLTKNLLADVIQPEKYNEAVKVFKNCNLKQEIIASSQLDSSQVNLNFNGNNNKV
jgi:hypothetical protein